MRRPTWRGTETAPYPLGPLFNIHNWAVPAKTNLSKLLGRGFSSPIPATPNWCQVEQKQTIPTKSCPRYRLLSKIIFFFFQPGSFVWLVTALDNQNRWNQVSFSVLIPCINSVWLFTKPFWMPAFYLVLNRDSTSENWSHPRYNCVMVTSLVPHPTDSYFMFI